MIERVLKDNIKDFDCDLLEYTVQIRALNYLKKRKLIKDDLYEKVKSVITQNYTLEINDNKNYINGS